MSIFQEHYLKNGRSSTLDAWLTTPGKCPMCHVSIEPTKITCKYVEENNCIFLIWFCNHCNRPFIASYKNPSYSIDKPTSPELFPKFYTEYEFEQCIKDLSATFCEIYNQSLKAEMLELSQIAGMGYRKALEFLIKDYCIYRNPDDKSKIQSALLSQVITEYVDSSKIKNLAKASAWIGNDETHYIRKFEDKDINDLKKFISATVAFITYELTSDEAEQLISSNSK